MILETLLIYMGIWLTLITQYVGLVCLHDAYKLLPSLLGATKAFISCWARNKVKFFRWLTHFPLWVVGFYQCRSLWTVWWYIFRRKEWAVGHLGVLFSIYSVGQMGGQTSQVAAATVFFSRLNVVGQQLSTWRPSITLDDHCVHTEWVFAYLRSTLVIL